MKIYRVIATEIDTDTGEEREVLNDSYEGFVLYGDQDEKFHEVFVHETITGFASKLAQGSRGKVAAKLAGVMSEARATFMEDDLLDLINGRSEE